MSLLLLFHTSGEAPPVESEIIYGVAGFQLEMSVAVIQEHAMQPSISLAPATRASIELEE